MELLLNLIWLLLAVPAFCVWRATKSSPATGKQSPQSWLTLACILILLFPVVSATDDLQAMRPVMEESCSQDALGNPHHGRVLASARTLCDSFASPASLDCVRPEPAVFGLVTEAIMPPPAIHFVMTRAGRAPPLSFLG
jgi:hypothetical protein